MLTVRDTKRESVDFIKTERTYNYFIDDCSKISSSNIHSIESFSKSIHAQMENVVALSYLIKNRGPQNKVLLQLSKEIWDYLIKNEIMITTKGE